MTIHRLWTLCIVGESEQGGTPCMRVRTTEEVHDSTDFRSELECAVHEAYAAEHPGHVIVHQWWAFEEMEDHGGE